MQVIRDLKDFPQLSWPVVTSGTFDGVHRGHQKILDRLLESARQHQGQAVVLTYWPHPRLVLQPDDTSLRLLSTIEERIELLKKAGVEYLLLLPFTKAFSELSSEEFIRQVLLEGMGTKKLVIGYDHRFGHNREGSFEHLRQHATDYGFDVEEIPRQDVDDVAVSSTKIRKALEEGQVQTAAQYLGRFYTLTGTVSQGQQLGRTIGFPTANIEPASPIKLIPGRGVYAVHAEVNGSRHQAMLNIGTRPTVDGTRQTIEAHLFDFNQDIYGRELTLTFVKRLRAEQKFASVEELRQQLAKDREQALAVLQQRPSVLPQQP